MVIETHKVNSSFSQCQFQLMTDFMRHPDQYSTLHFNMSPEMTSQTRRLKKKDKSEPPLLIFRLLFKDKDPQECHVNDLAFLSHSF